MTNTKRWLLDTNALIALLRRDHVHHPAVRRWFDEFGRHAWATCPITQAGFVRICAAAYGISQPEARRRLERGIEHPAHSFWPADVSYSEAISLLLEPMGHKQVTDAYLLGLALHHGGQLATFDKALKIYFGEGVELIAT
ncbi:MAG: TA system VapC family ribonuclease toxin [Bryobacteraceae bacterium]|nr:TA system VapC family ribonuclease toxin [Bryobacteraceae bacterium]